VTVDPGTRGQLLWLAGELLRWNRHVNLTAITVLEEVVERHLVDSLTLVSMLSGTERVLDVGSGGGFPGLPLKIVMAGLRLVSVDAVAKKINFQRHVIRRLGLSGCLALHTRIEEVPRWEGFEDGFDVIVSRALASLDDFARLALPSLAPGGRLIAMKGPDGAGELCQKKMALADLKVGCDGIERKTLPGSGAERLLITLRPSK
jgi:16S rRNA (guanine527-N7)-methyltransferase